MIHLSIQLLGGLTALYCAIEASERWGISAPFLYLGLFGLFAVLCSLWGLWP